MAHHHKYSIQDLENMYPFELDLYVSMIGDFNNKQTEAGMDAQWAEMQGWAKQQGHG